MLYKLSASLVAHSSDVRAVVSPTNDLVISASRDTTAISWQRTSSSSTFEPTTTFRPGSRYVNAVTYIPPSEDAPQGYVVTAGQEMVVNIFRLDLPGNEPQYSLIGHQHNICTLHTAQDDSILSGSWDHTAKVWKDFKLAYDLKGHTQSVLTVVAMEGNQFLTGSADKTIKMWRQHKAVRTFAGHKDAVRGLALVTDIGFASCSNDSEIHVWTLEGDLVYTLSGHTSFVYGLSIIPNGDIISCGEDRTVRVWRDGDCIQTITHPAVSVWAVSTMPNGDIVSGCSDAVVRVFSCSEDRWLPEADLKAFDDEVANQALPAQQVGDVKASDLPGLEALAVPGKKSGETKMIKNEGAVEAHQWDASSSSWIKIGTVVDAVGSGRKQLYNGREYDHVFDVDVKDGAPPLKLPYNVTENPWSAAKRFLEENELPLTYFDEVVRFIEKNTAGISLGVSGSEAYSDPFTGSSRYQPPSSSSAPAATAGGEDPFTGASRYLPSPQSSSSSGPSSLADPVTCASRYQPNASAPSVVTPPPPTSNRAIPHRTPITFKQCNIPAMRSKLNELNAEVQMEISTSPLALFPEEFTLFTETFDYLEVITGSRSDFSNVIVPRKEHVEAIQNVLDRWPAIYRFPLMDLVRLMIVYCPEPMNDTQLRKNFLQSLLRAVEWDDSWTLPMSKAKERNLLLFFRATANAFQEHTRVGDTPWALEVFQQMQRAPYESFTAQHRIVAATILLNFSCVCLNDNDVQRSLRTAYFEMVIVAIRLQPNDNETTYRAMIALGNIIYLARQRNAIAPEDEKKVRDVVKFVENSTYMKAGQTAAEAAAEKARAISVGREILEILS